MDQPVGNIPTREKLLHALYEAAELEHNLMCTYLYAAFSLKSGAAEGLSAREAEAVARWRQTILRVAVEEMGHLVAVWNITSALGGSPRFGRGNFPLDPGMLPAGVIVKLAPFSEAVLQHFIFLERPADSIEPDGDGFTREFDFRRATPKPRLTPMGLDYETVGTFYDTLGASLRAFVEAVGEAHAFCGDPALQLSTADVPLDGAKPVRCLHTALAAFTAIVQQGEGAPVDATNSHFQKFIAIRRELTELKATNPEFTPAWPAAVNPVQRTPMRPSGRVWIEDEAAAVTVDVANASYALMLRLLAYAYAVPRPQPEKALTLDLAVGLMRAMTPLAERAARLPAGPSNPGCNAGMSFVALRDAAPFPPGAAARRFYVERFAELADAAGAMESTYGASDVRVATAARQLATLATRAQRGFESVADAAPELPSAPGAATQSAPREPERTTADGIEANAGKQVSVLYEAKRCIWAHFCVTCGPRSFLGESTSWIFPDEMDADRLVAVIHQCPSGALQYQRHDGKPDEAAPAINVVALREAGPYAVRGDIRIDGKSMKFRAALCRCGASKNKPFCDASHFGVNFSASGEPPSGATDMLAVRDGPLEIEPEVDGPLQIRGNMEIQSGTGRVVARITQARLCRCGGSATKPFCDGTHQRIGFRSD